MASANDVMAILKAVSIKVDTDKLFILSFMYHTETIAGPDGKEKTDRSKSQYRYEGRLVTIADLQNEITNMKANPDGAWRWPTLDTWRCSYDCEATNKRGAKWLEARIKKAVDWPVGEKLLNGWKPAKDDYKDARKYDIVGYTASNGNKIDINLDTVKALQPGDTVSKILTPKRAVA